MKETLASICPCNDCICVATCRQTPTTYLLFHKCNKVKEFYKEAWPYGHYHRFIAMKQSLKLEPHDDNSYFDWENLMSYNHRLL